MPLLAWGYRLRGCATQVKDKGLTLGLATIDR
jgi:hypothetical protein